LQEKCAGGVATGAGMGVPAHVHRTESADAFSGLRKRFAERMLRGARRAESAPERMVLREIGGDGNAAGAGPAALESADYC